MNTTELKAGRELDLLVAKAVEWKIVRRDTQIEDGLHVKPFKPFICWVSHRKYFVAFRDPEAYLNDWTPWSPSIHIAHAIEMVEEVAKVAWHLSKVRGNYTCQILMGGSIDESFEVEADTDCLAICLAVLKAKGGA